MRLVQGHVCLYYTQVAPLLLEHWDELAKNKELMQLAPNWSRYIQLEDLGKLLTVYAIDDHDKVIGYSCNLLDDHMHYQFLHVCSNDVLFVKPGQRGTVGLRLIAETERLAKARGAQLMMWHAKENSTLDKLLKAKRYSVQDIIYSTAL